MHLFVAGIMVHPDEERLDVLMRKIPATALPQPGDSSVGMVAGAGLAWMQQYVVKRIIPLSAYSGACRRQGVEPYTYLVDVLQRLDDHPARDVAALTPRLWKERFAADPRRSAIDREVKNVDS